MRTGQGHPAGNTQVQRIFYVFRVHLSLMVRHTGKRQPSTMFLWSSTFLCNPTVIRSELRQLQTRSCVSKTLVKPNKEPNQRYVLELLSRALFYVCETFHYKQCWNIQVSFHPCLNNGPFFFFLSWLQTPCQPDRFSHIAQRHQRFYSYCQAMRSCSCQSLMNTTLIHPSL